MTSVLTDVKVVLRNNGYKICDYEASLLEDDVSLIIEIDDIPEFKFESFNSYRVKYQISIFVVSKNDETMVDTFERIIELLSANITNKTFKFDQPEIVDYRELKTLKIDSYYEKVITW
jgi:hypothetical protein